MKQMILGFAILAAVIAGSGIAAASDMGGMGMDMGGQAPMNMMVTLSHGVVPSGLSHDDVVGTWSQVANQISLESTGSAMPTPVYYHVVSILGTGGKIPA
ncbi:MAG: hypothetical protein ACYDDF_06645 [Thermoplasmatota archaeon]